MRTELTDEEQLIRFRRYERHRELAQSESSQLTYWAAWVAWEVTWSGDEAEDCLNDIAPAVIFSAVHEILKDWLVLEVENTGDPPLVVVDRFFDRHTTLHSTVVANPAVWRSVEEIWNNEHHPLFQKFWDLIVRESDALAKQYPDLSW